MRELTGGIYFGEKGTCEKNGEKGYFDTLIYYESEIQRIAHLAFSLARQRGKKVTSIDKANVLSSMKFWRETVNKIAKDFPDIEYQDLYVDNASMQLILNPDGSINKANIQNKNLENGKFYYIATNDYLKNGGDHMDFFLYPLQYKEVGIKLRDAIMQFVKKKGDQNEHLKGKEDGRITFI